MQVIELQTRIAAPVERCFLLSLSIDLHVESTQPTRERAVAGVTHGVIGPGQTVTWRGRHFGVMLEHTSLIDRYEAPTYFRDVMTRGMFKSFEHEHLFESDGEGGTVMRDRLRFVAPLALLGRVAEAAVLRRYFKRFLLERNRVIRAVAEQPGAWRRYLEEEQ